MQNLHFFKFLASLIMPSKKNNLKDTKVMSLDNAEVFQDFNFRPSSAADYAMSITQLYLEQI